MSNARKLADNLPIEGQLSGRNLIINGGMQIWQRSSATTTITNSSYPTVDRFRCYTGGATYTSTRSTDVPSGQGFSYSNKFDVAGADNALGAGSFYVFKTRLEGSSCMPLCYGTSDAKTITLSNDKFYSKPHLELGYNRQIIGGLYLNSSLSTFSGYTDHTSGRFEGGFEVANFPRINIWGNLLEIGPNYRFNNNSSFTPFIGINASYLFGEQDNTRFSFNAQEYGVGGDHTHVKCFGYSPEIGFFKNSGLLKGLGLKIDLLNLNCSNGNMRSFFNGYDGEFSQLRYQIDFRIF